MRRTWDALAAGETAVYVGDPATGAEELAGLFGRLGADPRGGTCVEVGCGPGRMTGALAERFDRVVALDVSPAMLEQARANVTAPNVDVRAVAGRTARRASTDGSADALVCYLVLQHLPSARVVRSYLLEFGRVLAPGGEAFVQVPVLGGALGRAWRGVRGAARPARPQARPGRRLPRLPPDRAPSSTTRSPTPVSASSPRTRAPPPTASAATASCGSLADDRRRTRRLRRPARRDRRGRLPPAAGRALPLRPRPARCTTSSCRSSTGAACTATRSTRSRPGRRSCSRPRSPRSPSPRSARAACRSARTSSTGSRSPTRRSSSSTR